MRRTEKYVSAVGMCARLRLTRATRRETLYNALRTAGYVWAPDMGPRGGWCLRSELAGERPARPSPEPAAEPVPRASPYAGLPGAERAAHEAALVARVDMLEARVNQLARALAVLQDTGAVKAGMAEIFGYDRPETRES